MAEIVRTQRCETCKFVNPEPNGSFACRRMPPKMDTFIVGFVPETGYDTHQIVTFPTTFADLWCGEWKPKLEGIN